MTNSEAEPVRQHKDWRPRYVQESKVGKAKIFWGGGKGECRGYKNRQKEV